VGMIARRTIPAKSVNHYSHISRTIRRVRCRA